MGNWSFKDAGDSVEYNIDFPAVDILGQFNQMFFSPDGLNLIVAGATLEGDMLLVQFKMTNAWDLSTMYYYSQSSELNSNSTNFFLNSAGNKLFIGLNSVIRKYVLTTAWDIDTLSYQGYSGFGLITIPDFTFDETGHYIYFNGNYLNLIQLYLEEAYVIPDNVDLSSSPNVESKNLASLFGLPSYTDKWKSGLSIGNNNNSLFFMADFINSSNPTEQDPIVRLDFGTSNDMDTLSVVENDRFYTTPDYLEERYGFNNNGSKLYIVTTSYIGDSTGNKFNITEISLSNGTILPIKHAWVKIPDEGGLGYRESDMSTVFDRPAFILSSEGENTLNINTNNRGGILYLIMTVDKQAVIDDELVLSFNLEHPSFDNNGYMNLRMFATMGEYLIDSILPFYDSWGKAQYPYASDAWCGYYFYLSTLGDNELYQLNIRSGDKYFDETWYAGVWYGDEGEMHILDFPEYDTITLFVGIEINDRGNYNVKISDFEIKNKDTGEVYYSNDFKNITPIYEDDYEDDYGSFGGAKWVMIDKLYCKKYELQDKIKKVYLKGD